jgi:GNAT superfamily N-acetyltransferase
MIGRPAPVEIRAVRPPDAEALRALRIEALTLHPVAFTADLAAAETKPIEAWRDDVVRAAGEGTQVIFVADPGDGNELVGMAGVFTPEQPKLAHVGTVWGVYVRAAFRGRGVGERLVRACATWARGKGLVGLRLSAVGDASDATTGATARRCYERCGFVPYGVEPFAVRWEGRLYDETLMALRF